jgi:hypothetical protein
MLSYLQCSICGAPNESKGKCSYCGTIFNENVVLNICKTDKIKLDLGIYELREGRTGEAKRIFDSILLIEPNNKLALFYKYLVEISFGNSLDKVSCRLIDLEYAQIDSTLANDLLKQLENSLSYLKKYLCENFLIYIEKLPINTQIKFLETMTLRYSNKDLSASVGILHEFELLLKYKNLLLLNSITTKLLINKIKDIFYTELEYKEKSILFRKNSIIRKSKYSKEPPEENEYLTQYLNEEYKFISVLKEATFLKTISEIEFENYIEKCEKKDEQIRKAGEVNIENLKEIKKSSGCFIATATMGSYNHPVVMDLRYFRDNSLLTKDWGKCFVNWYYKNGPFAARLIEKSSILKKITYYFIILPLHGIIKIFFK